MVSSIYIFHWYGRIKSSRNILISNVQGFRVICNLRNRVTLTKYFSMGSHYCLDFLIFLSNVIQIIPLSFCLLWLITSKHYNIQKVILYLTTCVLHPTQGWRVTVLFCATLQVVRLLLLLLSSFLCKSIENLEAYFGKHRYVHFSWSFLSVARQAPEYKDISLFLLITISRIR